MTVMVSAPGGRSYTSTEARTHWRDIMDASSAGIPVTISRQDSTASAVTDAEQLRRYLSQSLSPRALTYFENGVHALVLNQRGFVSEGETIEEAIDDMVSQLREYVEDWAEHFSTAPNHADNWALVQLVSLSTDEQVREWLVNGGN